MKLRTLPVLAAMLLVASSSIAQKWQKDLDLGLNVTQNLYSANWEGGEIENFSWTGSVNGIFEKQISAKFNFRNVVILQFGQVIAENVETETWRKPEKTTDLIDIEAVGRIISGRFFDPYSSLRVETQFWDVSYEQKKRMFNPATFTESIGISKSLYSSKNNLIMERLGISAKENLNRAIQDTLGSKTKYQVAVDGGFEFTSDIQISFSGKYKLFSRLSIYQPILHNRINKTVEPREAHYWHSININFENNISVSATDFLEASLYTQFLYDKQGSLKGRFKEIMGIGLTYSIN